MMRRPPRSTRTDTLFPYTTLFRSGFKACVYAVALSAFGTAQGAIGDFQVLPGDVQLRLCSAQLELGVGNFRGHAYPCRLPLIHRDLVGCRSPFASPPSQAPSILDPTPGESRSKARRGGNK